MTLTMHASLLETTFLSILHSVASTSISHSNEPILITVHSSSCIVSSECLHCDEPSRKHNEVVSRKHNEVVSGKHNESTGNSSNQLSEPIFQKNTSENEISSFYGPSGGEGMVTGFSEIVHEEYLYPDSLYPEFSQGDCELYSIPSTPSNYTYPADMAHGGRSLGDMLPPLYFMHEKPGTVFNEKPAAVFSEKPATVFNEKPATVFDGIWRDINDCMYRMDSSDFSPSYSRNSMNGSDPSTNHLIAGGDTSRNRNSESSSSSSSSISQPDHPNAMEYQDHFISEQYLFNEVNAEGKRIYDIGCPKCDELVSYKNLVDYIVKMVLSDPECTNRNRHLSHAIIRILLPKLLKEIGVETTILLLTIDDIANVKTLLNYCVNLQDGLKDEYLNSFNKTLREVKDKMIRCGLYNKKMANKTNVRCPRNIITPESQITVSIMYLKIEQASSSPSIISDTDYYLDLAQKSRIRLKAAYCHAKLLLLLSNPGITIEQMTPYFLPYICDTIVSKDHPVRKYIAQYSRKYTGFEYKHEMPVELLLRTNYKIALDKFYLLLEEYLEHPDNTMGRICGIISRIYTICSSPLSPNQQLIKFKRFLTKVETHYKSSDFSLEVHDRLQNMGEACPLVREKLIAIRVSYLSANIAPAEEIIQPIVGRIGNAISRGVLAPVGDILLAFSGGLRKPKNLSFFNELIRILTTPDAKFLVLSDLIKYDVLNSGIGYGNFRMFTNYCELEHMYLSSFVFFIVKSLISAEAVHIQAFANSDDVPELVLPKTVVNAMNVFARTMCTWKDNINQYICEEDDASLDTLVICGFTLCYNSFVNTYAHCLQVDEIELDILTPEDCEMIFRLLCGHRKHSKYSEYMLVLDRVIADVFSFFIVKEHVIANTPDGPAFGNGFSLTYQAIRELVGLSQDMNEIYMKYLRGNSNYYDTLKVLYFEENAKDIPVNAGN